MLLPDLRPHLARRPAERPRVLGAERHVRVGVVVEEGELGAPAHPHRVARRQHDADDGAQALRPGRRAARASCPTSPCRASARRPPRLHRRASACRLILRCARVRAKLSDTSSATFGTIGEMTSREVRRSFLDYFAKNGHTVVPSSSLVPEDDPTLLFTNAGMNQFKDVFLGKEKRDYPRATTVQKVHAGQRQAQRPRQRRAVAPASHLLRDARQLLVRRLLQEGRDSVRVDAADRGVEAAIRIGCIPTIFKGENGIPRDDEAFEIWTQFVPADRITALGASENFWQMGETGPCGRCTEIMFYRPDAPCTERGLPRPGVQLRPLLRDLEQRVHGVQPPEGRRAAAAAGAVGRHRHGLRAHHLGAAAQVLELRHRHLHADPGRDRRGGRPEYTQLPRRRRSPRTSRCGSSRITSAR